MRKTLTLLWLLVFLFSQQAQAKEFPLPQGAVKQASQDTKINNVNYTLDSYETKLRPEEVYSFYKKELPAQGFNLSDEDLTSGVLHFSNQLNDHLVIMAQEEEGRTLISITSWRGSAASVNAAGAFPKLLKDAPGEDLPDIPRYPRTIRLSSTSFAGVRTAAYTSEDAKEAVASFYATQMNSRGWQRAADDFYAKKQAGAILNQQAVFEKADFFFFTRKDEVCGVFIAEACCGNTGTVISLMKMSKKAIEALNRSE
jgi:hypothetical protein